MADITSVVVGELAGLGNSEILVAVPGQTKKMSGHGQTWDTRDMNQDCAHCP